jgi:hypothetical protein
MPWSRVDWYKFFFNLRTLNVRHFGMVEVTRLKLRRRGHLQCHNHPTEFHKNIQNNQSLEPNTTKKLPQPTAGNDLEPKNPYNLEVLASLSYRCVFDKRIRPTPNPQLRDHPLSVVRQS